MALSDMHWNKILEAISLKTQMTNPNEVFLAFKENWELFSDEAALDKFLQPTKLERLEKLKASREHQQCCLDGLCAEIEELEKER